MQHLSVCVNMAETQEQIGKLGELQYDRLMRLRQSLTNFKKDSLQRKTKNYFRERLNKAKEMYEQFIKTHEQLVILGVGEDHDYVTKEVRTLLEEAYYDLYDALTEKEEQLFPSQTLEIQQQATTTPTNVTNHVTHTSSIQFARMPAPTFSGNFIDWPGFHDAFDQLINKNEDLTNVQRFHYLKKALPSERDADVHNMLMTDDNYDTAWALIKKRYNNSRILFAHHMNCLYALPTLVKESADDIKSLLNAATVCINEFKRLKIPIDSCDHWLTHYLSTKLPNETHKDWERHLGSETTIPTFITLENFLTNRLFIIDAIEHRTMAHQINTKPSNGNLNNVKYSNGNQRQNKSHTYGKAAARTTTTHSFHLKSQNHQLVCVICKQDHIFRRCPTFLNTDCFTRNDLAVKHKVCLNCLSTAHTINQCLSIKNCNACGDRHHTSLHTPKNDKIIHTAQPAATSDQITNAHANFNKALNDHSVTVTSPVLLATAMVTVQNSITNQSGVFCALIDQGSEGTIISENVVQTLRLIRSKASADICGIGGNPPNQSKYVVSCSLTSKTRPQFSTFIECAHVLPKLNIYLPSRQVVPQRWTHIDELDLADPTYYRQKKIDLIIGADIYPNIILADVKSGNGDQPLAQNTKLGWILSGKTSSPQHNNIKIRCNVNLIELESLVKTFYEIDEVPNAMESEQNQWCEDYFKKTHIRQPNGKYMVRLPLKSRFDSTQTLGKSKQVALNRFLHLERRLQRNAELAKGYQDAIKDYFELKQIIPVNPNCEKSISPESTITSCVLPHHAVIKEDSLTTKLRIVFDASAKTSNGRSLNDVLCVGKPLLNDLSAVLLNWRTHKFVFLADIQKMYRCIDMHPEDAQYQRILWRNQDNQIQEYCLTTVTFGTASAPFTAIRVLHQLAEDEQTRYPLAANILRYDIYVDDVLSGSDTITSAAQMQNQIIAALKSAGMELRKWSSNAPELLQFIPKDHQSIHAELALNQKATVKTLGLNWNPTNDQLKFVINFEIPQILTKRTILSMIARLFDPLGFISPVVISAKLILKEIWTTANVEWDEPLPKHIANKFIQFTADIKNMNEINIPRWINTTSSSQLIEIHAFCDGSSTSYAAAVYLRIQQQSKIYSNLIVAKSRVTPTKPLTIPRIELCGAVLATKLTRWVQQHLRIFDENVPVFYWTDASIVLFWIHGETNRWQSYVSNRVNQILSNSSAHQWNHVPTTDNPADCATRGLTPTQLSKFHLWWNGPTWLLQDKKFWPKFQYNKLVIDHDTTEQKRSKLQVNFSISQETIIFKYSSLQKLQRVHAWIFRFHHNCKCKPETRQYGALTVNELKMSMLHIVRLVQKESFGTERNLIKRNSPLPAGNKLNNLTPFLDNDQILRIRGRLENSNLTYDQKHPIILPSIHHFTNLIIDAEHIQTQHGGTQLTLAKIRQRFWIINERRSVRNRIKACIHCFRQRPQTITQLMGDLPTNRVVPPTRPFISTGVDYTGAIGLKASRYRGHTNYKGYIAIFICLATKAIHLEAVTGLTTQHFLWALQRFIGRRGLCKNMYSDCGTNFTGANNMLQTSVSFSQDEVASKLASKGIQWHFNPPYSPNFGGLWEANVKATKYHLKRVIGNNSLTYEELSTVLVQIEACLNSRPLCPMTTDPTDLFVLTPAHFLITDSLLASPEIDHNAKGLTEQFHKLQRIIQRYWKRCSSDWLSHLQSRPKWMKVETNLKQNELVIVKEDNLPPNQWMLGRVVDTHPGRDNLVRVVTVRTKNGVCKRSISKICRLPIIPPHESNTNSH